MSSDVGDPQDRDAVIPSFDDLVKNGLDPHAAAVEETAPLVAGATVTSEKRLPVFADSDAP
jgi:hypothetical protein